MKILLSIISILLDIVFNNVFTSAVNSISYFYPMFTITSIVYLSNFYSNANRKNYYVLILFVSIIYDSFVINNLLISISLFISIAIVNIKLKNYLANNLINNFLRLILSIILYEILFNLLLVIIGYKMFDIHKIIYKVTHSLIINIFYLALMFLVLKEKKS